MFSLGLALGILCKLHMYRMLSQEKCKISMLMKYEACQYVCHYVFMLQMP